MCECEKEAVKFLIDGLQHIADPIGYSARNLKDGETMNYLWTLQLSENVEHLKSIAKDALLNFTIGIENLEDCDDCNKSNSEGKL